MNERKDTYYMIERYWPREDNNGNIVWELYPRTRFRDTLDEAIAFADEQKSSYRCEIYECSKVRIVEYDPSEDDQMTEEELKEWYTRLFETVAG